MSRPERYNGGYHELFGGGVETSIQEVPRINQHNKEVLS